MVESELEQALREAAEGSSQARRRVYELLAQASLHVQAAGPPDLVRGGLMLSTLTRVGGIELAAFTSLERALTWNPDADVYRAHAPAIWIFSEAQRLGCAAVWINPPQCEIRRADFLALADGRVPGPLSPPATPSPPVPATVGEPAKPAPVPASPAKPPRFMPRKDAPRVLAPSGPVPKEALAYLVIALGGVDDVSAAYFFDLIMPGEPRVLCLGLRIDLPPAQWDEFIEATEQLADIPGFPDGVAACPLNDEMLASARKLGVQVL